MNSPKPFSIIPLPQTLQLKAGQFVLNAQTRIYANDATGQVNANLLSQAIENAQGIKLAVQLGNPGKHEKNIIVFHTVNLPSSATVQENEAYQFSVKANAIQISASAAGQFYAMQSLLQ
ncbi:MAG: hypothetical protein NTY70_11390, partial [Burkholderiales bacterium]|nr:hypothetical protein [Burkholderiales bacterium]